MDTNSGKRPGRAWLPRSLVLAVASLGFAFPAAGEAAVSTLSFPSVADTWVTSGNPDASFGTAASFAVDAAPTRQAFLRFDLAGLGGRPVVGARLRMYATDGSDQGGRAFAISDNGWDESMTWNTRPAIDGSQLGSFGPVASDTYYEADLGTPALADGAVSLAVDSDSADEARWASREEGNKAGKYVRVPRLIVEVESGDDVSDGTSEVAGSSVGSSSPTYYGTQHRLALTDGGRLLTVHGLHGTGVQLAWRDPAGNWQNQTRGATPDGLMIGDTETGDWPASIAVARDRDGVEHAWVVFARASTTKADPVYMRRLSDLDSAQGPSVGPLVAVDSPPLGAYKPDIAFERAPNGRMRGAVLWQRQKDGDTYQTVAGWMTNLTRDDPRVRKTRVLDRGAAPKRQGTLFTARGMNALVRAGAEPLVLYKHRRRQPLRRWAHGADGALVGPESHPSAVGVRKGKAFAAVDGDAGVKVLRYRRNGNPKKNEIDLPGYSMPTLASNRRNVWLVMVRAADGAVVSREFTPGDGWSATDTVEIAPGSGPHAHPNAIRKTDGRLRFIVEGFGSSPATSSVIAFQRGL